MIATGRPFRTRFRFASGYRLKLATIIKSPIHDAKGTPSGIPLARHSPRTACRHRVSGSFNSPNRGSFHLSLAVLVHYRSPASIQPYEMVLADSGRISRVPPYLGTPSEDTARFRLQDYHLLWSVFPDGSPTEPFPPGHPHGAPQPRLDSRPTGLGMSPRSLATTSGIAVCFLFLRVLRCFTSPGSPLATMDSSQAEEVLPSTGFPIRTSTDQSLVSSSPWLFAATHVLHRLLEPRHPPCALSSLVTLDSSLPSSRSGGTVSRPRSRPFGGLDRIVTMPVDAFLPFVFGCQRARLPGARTARSGRDPRSRGATWWS